MSAEFAQNITFNAKRIHKALPAGYLDATTLADYLVKKASYFVFVFVVVFFFLPSHCKYSALFAY